MSRYKQLSWCVHALWLESKRLWIPTTTDTLVLDTIPSAHVSQSIHLRRPHQLPTAWETIEWPIERCHRTICTCRRISAPKYRPAIGVRCSPRNTMTKLFPVISVTIEISLSCLSHHLSTGNKNEFLSLYWQEAMKCKLPFRCVWTQTHRSYCYPSAMLKWMCSQLGKLIRPRWSCDCLHSARSPFV